MRGRALLTAALCLAGPALAGPVEYLHINANEGTASGGHVALKLGAEVFHFQHVPPGLLRLRRDDFAAFRLEYGERENRSLRLRRAGLPDSAFEALRERLSHLLMVEDEQFERRDGLERDLRLLDILLDRQGGGAERLAVPGTGLFLPDGWDGADPPAAPGGNAALARLARRAGAVLGVGFLKTRQAEILAELRGLRPGAEEPPAPAENVFQPAPPSFADRYLGRLAALAALQTLERRLDLREGAPRTPPDPEFRLSEAQRRGLDAYRTKLEGQLLELLRATSGPDFGHALLLGMARLAALDAALAAGRWVFLDLAGPDAAPQAAAPAFAAYARERARFLAAKNGIDEAMDEWAYVELEQAANRFAETAAALREGRAPRRLAPDPARPALAAPIPSMMEAAELRAWRGRLARRGAAYAEGLRRLYAYDLVGRNCASELFRLLDGLGVEAPALGFIPFAAFDAVGERWPAGAELPSRRLRLLERARREEGAWLAEARESNVFTARLYRWHGGDAAFLFFTDGMAWARPLAGAANLAAGLGQAGLGVFALPWDRGENLWQGLKGTLVSLPELVFFNIRKGSYPNADDFPE